MKYSIRDLQADFPDDDACLDWLTEYLYPDGVSCIKCERVTKHYKDSGRRSYSCGVCGNHMHPTAGTIFEKTKLPLTHWLYAIHRMTTTRSGFPATQLQRELGVTYKTAWRMLHLIRSMMAPDTEPLMGEIEIDETFIHANVYKRSSAQQRYGWTGSRMGQVVFGMVSRTTGEMRMFHVQTAGTRVLMPILEREIGSGSVIYSDGWNAYDTLPKRGYRHLKTNHSNHEWVNGDNHTQTIESVWSRFKPGIKAVYRHVSSAYLQLYCNEFAWRHTYRQAISMFWALLDACAQPALRFSRTAF